jgi:hypothetical protein
VFAEPQRGHLSCSCSGKLGFMGWNVAGSCILTFYLANQYRSKKKGGERRACRCLKI